MFTIEIFAYKWTLEVQICVVQGSTVSLISVRPLQGNLVIILWFTNFPIMLHLCSRKEKGGTELRKGKPGSQRREEGRGGRRHLDSCRVEGKEKSLTVPRCQEESLYWETVGGNWQQGDKPLFFPRILVIPRKETEKAPAGSERSMSIWDAIRTSMDGWLKDNLLPTAVEVGNLRSKWTSMVQGRTLQCRPHTIVLTELERAESSMGSLLQEHKSYRCCSGADASLSNT